VRRDHSNNKADTGATTEVIADSEDAEISTPQHGIGRGALLEQT
jgi:hypothetical protein